MGNVGEEPGQIVVKKRLLRPVPGVAGAAGPTADALQAEPGPLPPPCQPPGYRSGPRSAVRVTAGDFAREAIRWACLVDIKRERKLTAAKRDREQGLPVADERLTVGDYLVQWLENDARPTIRPGTYAAYASHIRVHLVPALGATRLARLTPRQVQAMQAAMLEKGVAPATVQRVRATLRRALNRAVRTGVLSRNVATLVDAPRAPRVPVRVLTPVEARQLLEAFKGHSLEAPVTLALATGLRQGEMLALRWQDVDLEAGTLTVRHALQRVHGRPVLVEPKTDRSLRTVHVPAFAVATLRAHRAVQNRARLAAGRRWQDGAYVFASDRGTPLDGTNVTHRFQARLAETDLPRMRWHDLRHACASLLLALGTNPRYVMEQLGHSGISVTMNTYAHVMPGGMKEAADRLDSALTGNA